MSHIMLDRPSDEADKRLKENRPCDASVRAEAWRGAKFGAKWAAIIFGILAIVSTIFVVGFEAFHWMSSGDMATRDNKFWLELPNGLIGTLVAILISSVYGAIAGAIIMALGAAMRNRRSSPNEPPT